MASRLTLSLPDRSKERLEALLADTEAGTYSAVISNALRLYEWAINEAKAGNKFCVHRPDGTIVEKELFG